MFLTNEKSLLHWIVKRRHLEFFDQFIYTALVLNKNPKRLYIKICHKEIDEIDIKVI